MNPLVEKAHVKTWITPPCPQYCFATSQLMPHPHQVPRGSPCISLMATQNPKDLSRLLPTSIRSNSSPGLHGIRQLKIMSLRVFISFTWFSMGVGLIACSSWCERAWRGKRLVLVISRLKLYQHSESRLKEKEKRKKKKKKKHSLPYCSYIKFQEKSLIGSVWIICSLPRPIIVTKRWKTLLTYVGSHPHPKAWEGGYYD